MTSNSEQYLKSKDILDLYAVNFCIRKLFIKYNTGSCCVDVTDGVNIYLYVYQSIVACESCVC